MKSKAEIKAVRAALEGRLLLSEDVDHFEKGLLGGAIDALSWALGETTITNKFFTHYAAHVFETQKGRKLKKIIEEDSFAD